MGVGTANGSEHYKSGGVEPLDLMESGGMLDDFALGSIMKYAFRCRKDRSRSLPDKIRDMEKIMDYANVMKMQYEQRRVEVMDDQET